MTAERVLVISHGHPDLSLGGGEIAAHAQWQELRRQGVDALFLARNAAPSGHVGTPFSSHASDGREVFFHAPPVEHFRHSQPDRRVVYEDFHALLESFRPTAVHFHHYVHLGLELVREARRYSSDIPILMTLHDYLGMCNAQGQMRKTNGILCQRATPQECHGCFPERSAQDFFMRELFVKSFFMLVDRFICPSQFLRDRYVAWGLPAERMVVLENGQRQPGALTNGLPLGVDALEAVPAEGAPVGSGTTRFVVLGQISELKGTRVLLDAVRALPKSLRRAVRIEVYGSLQHTSKEIADELHAVQEKMQPTLRYCGPYLPGKVDTILRSAHWAIVPSIWWENSPMVIQEAFGAQRPIICSNIGGMAEKVTHGLNGLHFMVGSATDLALRIEEAATTPGLWARLHRAVPRPPTIDETVARLLQFYRAGRAPTERLRVVAAGSN